MFGKFALVALAIASPLHVFGHALIEPAIGVTGAGARSDVQKPSTAKPCGSVNVASALAGSTPVQATNGAFTVTVQNFNAGKDGSTQIQSTQVDPSGTGSSFTGGAVTITKNGVLAPTSVGSVQVSGSLPAGTQCTGGTDGASCLVSFTTAGGFGNCVLVSQGAAAGGAVANAAAGNTTTTATNGTTTDSTTAATNGTTTDTTTTATNGTTTDTTVSAAAAATATTTTTTAGKGKHHHHGAKAQNRRMMRRRLSAADFEFARREQVAA